MRENKGTMSSEKTFRRDSKGLARNRIGVNKVILILFMLGHLFASCQESKVNEKKYAWGGAVIAPTEYPVEIYDGALSNGEEYYFFGPIYGILSQGWNSFAKAMGSSDQPTEFPDELMMTWYSIQEQKFYTGNWKLDKEQIYKVWNEGVINVRTGKREEFRTFIVGLAPKGTVALWAEGEKQVLLATFQAHDTSINKETANADFEHFFREDYRDVAYNLEKIYGKELYTELKNKGWPEPKIYLEYNKKFAWKFSVEGIDMDPKAYFFFQSFNGERDMFFNSKEVNTNLPKPIPQHIYVTWTDNKQQSWVADVVFKYEEIKNAFEQFDPTEKIDLLFQVDIASNVLNTYLKSSTKQVRVVGYDLSLVQLDE